MLELNNIEVENLKEKFNNDFKKAYSLLKKKNKYNEIIILCVGTDRLLGDCFGPIVGTKLIELFNKDNYSNINVYGSLEKCVNYNNLNSYIDKIDSKAATIIVDAAFSKKEHIGKIFVTNEGTVLGKGLNKKRIEIGDISIKGVVAKNNKVSKYNFKALQNISLGAITCLSKIVAEGIYDVIKNI